MPRIRACDACYKKKIQCSIRRPGTPCNWCRHNGLACTFTRESQTKKDYKFKPSDIQELFERVEHLESALAKASTSHQSQSEASLGPGGLTSAAADEDQPRDSRAGSSIGTGTFAGNESIGASPSQIQTILPPANTPIWRTVGSRSHLGQSWFYKGTAIFSDEGLKWISLRTGEQVTFDKFPLVCRPSDPPLPSALPTGQLRASFQELCNLPPKNVAERISHVIFETSFALVFPVLDKVLFQETFRIAYEAPNDTPSSPLHVLARACVLAALSVASRFEDSVGSRTSVDGDMCAAKAQSLLQHVNGDESVVTLQTVLMLQRHQAFSGQWQNADTLHSVACRIVCRLGGHIYQPLDPPNLDISLNERQTHHIRTLFWLCYMLDKDISLRSGRPPLLTEDYCDLTPAENNRSWFSPAPGLGRNLNASDAIFEKLVPHIPGQPRLSHLKERTCRLLYSARAITSTDGDHLHHIRQLDAELEIWRSSISSDLRPKLSIPPQSALLTTEPSSPHSMLRLILQLEYHYLVIAIHATVRRCRANGSKAQVVPDDLHSVLHSSTDLCLEASRSTLLVLKQSVSAMVTEGSRHIVFYPAVAAMSLFANILVHPADPESLDDAKLLESVVDIMRSIPLRTPTHGEVEYVRQTIAFVEELSHLGTCAIAKAMKEVQTPV